MTRTGRLLALLALAAALAAAADAPRRAGDRAVLAAVDAEAFAGLSGRRPEAAGDLWERLKAMGVSAVTLREETLADLAARGEILSFSRAEVDKWEGPPAWSRLRRRCAAARFGPGPEGVGPRGGRGWPRAASTFPPRPSAEPRLWSSLPASTSRSCPRASTPPRSPRWREPDCFRSRPRRPLSSPSRDGKCGRRSLPVDAAPGEILRAALGRPLRLIVFRPRAELGLEANIGLLRGALKTLRGADQPATLPAPQPPSDETPTSRLARLLLIWIIGAAGPLLAARAALQAGRLTRSRICAIAPVASPVPQVLAGMAAGWLVAAFAGLVVAGTAPEGWRDGSARAWTVWTWCAPFAVGAAALFASAKPARRGYWATPVRRRDLAGLAAFALAAALLLAPRAAVRASALWESFDRFSAAGALWWWPWHWRAALVGAPCLALALALIEERDGSDDPRRHASTDLGSDPRGWLLLGLLGPAGLVAAIGGGGAPLVAGLVYGGYAWALGLAVAALLAGLRFFLRRWAQGPKAHRSIDLETEA